MANNGYFLEASTSRCKKQMLELSGTSNSNHTLVEKSSVNLYQEEAKRRRRKAEIEQLEGRLRVLEEEAEMLKRALFESVEESNELITEIHHHFNSIKRRLLQELYSQRVHNTALCEDRRAGLLQVLCQESNPFIVNKGTRTQALGRFQPMHIDNIQLPSDLI